MKTFKELLFEVRRDEKRAQKFLGYLHSKNMPDDEDEYDEDQMLNLIPHASRRPRVDIDWDKVQDGTYPHEDIPVKNLTSGQHTVSRHVIHRKIEGTWPQHDPEIPLVIRHTHPKTGRVTTIMTDRQSSW